MGKVYYDQDGHIEAIQDKVIAIIGYGNQGRSQALNMRDSGAKHIIVGSIHDESWNTANADGFPTYSIAEASKKADIVFLLRRTKWLPRSTSAISLPTCIPAQH